MTVAQLKMRAERAKSHEVGLSHPAPPHGGSVAHATEDETVEVVG